MAYFTQVTDTRRFAVEGNNSVFAVYDYRPGASLFLAPVALSDDGQPVFCGEPAYFFSDEVREV